MIITREAMLSYWLEEPPWPKICFEVQAGYVLLGGTPFPDLQTLPPEWKEAYRCLMERHPEYLHFVFLSTHVIQ